MPTWSTEKPRITDRWRLRNDTRNLIAYKCSVLQHRFRALSPLEASLIPLFDGAASFDEIRAASLAMYDPPPGLRQRWLERIDDVFADLMSIQGFLACDGEVSPSLGRPMSSWIPDFSAYVFPPERCERPLSIMIAYTNRCVCDCRYCYAERRHCREIDLAGWRRIFDELADNEVFLVDIAGGDIFLRRDALDLLGEMVARDFTFFLSTKSYVSEATARRLAELGIGRRDLPPCLQRKVQVSIDSADEAVASALVRHPRYLEKSTQAVIHLLRAGISPRVKCVLTALNAGGAEDLVRHFAGLGVTEFDFVHYSRSYYRHRDELFLSPAQKLRIKEAAQRLWEELPALKITFQDETSEGRILKKTPEQWRERAVCSGGRSNMLIQPNGDVTLCDQTPHRAPFVMGNVLERGVMDVWRSASVGDFLYPERERFIGTACYGCPEFDECHHQRGYCYRDALFAYGSIYDAPPDCPRQPRPAPRKT